MTAYRLGIDIGGTFTDFALVDESTGHIQVMKVPSRPERPEQSVFDGIKRLHTELDVQPGEIRFFIHGTTLAVNTIIQRSGARTALLVTEGFRDILTIARHRIPDVFNFFTELPKPLVSRSLVYEIPERCSATGEILLPLDEDAVRDAAMKIREQGIDSLSVCFLHSYRNKDHELRARTLIEKAVPG